MRALFGEGLHPDADAITAALGEEGATVDEIRSAIALGARTTGTTSRTLSSSRRWKQRRVSSSASTIAHRP